MAIDLIKENIEYEQLLGENTSDNVIKAEYVIPDTLPDVHEILMLDARPNITSSEVMQNKVYVEGQIVYNVLYLSKEEKDEVFSVTYLGKFTNYIEVNGALNKMVCESEVDIEHMACNLVNERKISVEGIIKTKAKVSKNCSFDVIKDIKDSSEVQLLKNPTTLDKIVGVAKGNLVGKAHIVIPMDKPQIKSILKLNISLHKRDVKVGDKKVEVDSFALVDVLYKGEGERELEYIADDVMLRQEIEMEDATEAMEGYGNFILDNVEHNIKENDLGENRILDVDINVRAEVKVTTKANIEVIEDAYSPNMGLNMTKKDYTLNVIHGLRSFDTIVKENIAVRHNAIKPQAVALSKGTVCVTDKKLVENKAIIEGLLQVNVIYKVEDENKCVESVEEEIPFTCSVDIPGTKIDMCCDARLFLESLESVIEAGTIGIKAVINAEAKVSYESHKEFITNVIEVEEVPVKKASITIYCVQSGDTMWKIAKKYSIPVDNLSKINDLEELDNLNIGQKLIIPGRAII